jgi:hypothetical protein
MVWKRRGKKLPKLNFGNNPGICLEGQRKTMTGLSKDSWSLGQNFNPKFHKYKMSGNRYTALYSHNSLTEHFNILVVHLLTADTIASIQE